MTTLNLHNVPDDLVQRLKAAADTHRQGLGDEAIDRLSESFRPRRVAKRRTPEELKLLARQVRGEGNPDGLTPEFLRMAREYGRE